MGEILVDHGRIYAEECGAGPPVLLLHAGVADRRVWDPVAPALAAAGYRAIRYDVPGFGRSPAPTAVHSPVVDALAVLDAAGVTAAHLVGLSLGAATGIDVALAAPERVRSLTLVAPGLTGYRPAPLPGAARRMAAAEAGDSHGLAVEIARLYAPMSFSDAADGTSPDFAAQIIVDQAEHFMRDELGVEQPSAVEHLIKIFAPTLVVLGDRDLAEINDLGRRIAAEIPGARLVTCPDADHMLPLRVPDLLTAMLLDHLNTATNG